MEVIGVLVDNMELGSGTERVGWGQHGVDT
jgi:hypothetical protein